MRNIGARECPLCLCSDTALLHSRRDKVGVRDFYRCGVCDLVFVPSEFHIGRYPQKVCKQSGGVPSL